MIHKTYFNIQMLDKSSAKALVKIFSIERSVFMMIVTRTVAEQIFAHSYNVVEVKVLQIFQLVPNEAKVKGSEVGDQHHGVKQDRDPDTDSFFS